MSKYNDSFTLNMHDIELIEQALRVMWTEDEKEVSADQGVSKETPERIRKIHNLLGKIASQKTYYSEVNETSCPIG